MPTALNEPVRQYWEQAPCGVSASVVGDATPLSRDWFDRMEQARYTKEPFIHTVAQFPRHHGERLLEIGVGAGVDHLQWARAGTDLYGVDLTDAAVELTRARLAAYGLRSQLQRVDAEELPFPDGHFDTVYAWGVIHHSSHPERMVAEIHRVLRPGGSFLGMMYHRHSLKVLTAWAYWALLHGQPWLSFTHVLAHHVESPGTKAYTRRELRALFSAFATFSASPIKTLYDTRVYPRWLHRFFPEDWGWFVVLHATKETNSTSERTP